MKKSLPIIAYLGILLLTSCTMIPLGSDRSYETVRIIGQRGGLDQTVSHGVRLSDIVLTSAHSVMDDRYRYSIQSGDTLIPLMIRERDDLSDRALLSLSDTPNISSLASYFSEDSRGKGAIVQAQVWRSGSLLILTGTIIEPYAQITGYTSRGQLHMLSGILMTDMDFLEGESGAPISTLSGELIDVVHVGGE